MSAANLSAALLRVDGPTAPGVLSLMCAGRHSPINQDG